MSDADSSLETVAKAVGLSTIDIELRKAALEMAAKVPEGHWLRTDAGYRAVSAAKSLYRSRMVAKGGDSAILGRRVGHFVNYFLASL